MFVFVLFCSSVSKNSLPLKRASLGGRRLGGGDCYVCPFSLHFKYRHFTCCGVAHVPVGIQPIFMASVPISSGLVSQVLSLKEVLFEW